MRVSDIEILKKEYVDKIDGSNIHFAKAVEVFLPNLQKLIDEIFKDLDVDRFGIGWWENYSQLDIKKRILISDQLLLCTSTIQSAIIEAKLHYIELLGNWEREEVKFKHCSQIQNRRKNVKLPENKSAYDELDTFLADLHLKGIFSSLNSALDCLASTYVGVFGLKFDILKVGYKTFRSHIKNSKHYELNNLQNKIFSNLEEIENKSGPKNWIEWMLDYRNMALHRGRRLTIGQLTPKPTGIIFMGSPLHETKSIKLLIKNPAVSEIESWKDGTFEPMNEDAVTTLSELLRSTLSLVELSAEYLLETWNYRKKNYESILQPEEQWPDVRDGIYNSFNGFTSKKLNFTDSPRIASEYSIKRLKAAGLDDINIRLWKN